MDTIQRMDTAELAETLDGVAELLDRCVSGGEPIDTKVAATMLAATRSCIHELELRWNEEQ
ncbi:hypothetical protein H7U34_11300 [Collinsella tanakaei]|nr:hypothetical protein [Collinsella tanakaei]